MEHEKIFLSYSRANSDFALKLANDLKAVGINIWIDQMDIPTGARWDDTLEKALNECPVFLVLLSPESIASQNVKDEIGYAIDAGKRILPVIVKACTVPLRLRRFQYVDFTDERYEARLEDIKKLTGFSSQNIPKETQKKKPAIQGRQTKSSSMGLMIGIGAIILAIVAVIIFVSSNTSLTGSSQKQPTAKVAVPSRVQPTAKVAVPTRVQPTPNAIAPANAPSAPLDYLNSNTNHSLYVGQSLQSKNGRYSLQINPDGNLVELENLNPIWASNTDGNTDVDSLDMQGDGNLVLYAKNRRVIWSSNTPVQNAAQAYTLALQDDGNLVIYAADGQVVWAKP